MKWVLIYYLLANSGNFAATGTATFDDEKACTTALDALAKDWPASDQSVYYTREPKKPGICTAQASAPAVIDRPPAAPGIPATKGTR